MCNDNTYTDGVYRYEKHEYEDGLFDNPIISATYIIHLEGNGQESHILDQLKEYHPTNIVYIVHNPGYKSGKKASFITNSAYDLVDANLNIFNHAKKQNYDNILILEDDFIFNPDIKKSIHIENIKNFLIKKANTDFQYYFGCLPLIMIPYDKYNYINKSVGTHCVVHSKAHRNKLLNKDQKQIYDWDHYNNYCNNRYAYYRPLCYQLFPETENSKNWGVNIHGFEYYANKYFLSHLFKKMLRLLKLDKQVKPGYYYVYIYSKILFYQLILLMIIFGIFIFRINKV